MNRIMKYASLTLLGFTLTLAPATIHATTVSSESTSKIEFTTKVDAFSHILLPNYYAEMLRIDPTIPSQYGFLKNPYLTDTDLRNASWDGKTQQILSLANILPEDYVGPVESARLVRLGNAELEEFVTLYADRYPYAVALVPMNNIEETKKIMDEVKASNTFVGIQIFSRALGKSIADPEFEEVFRYAEEIDMPLWLHPVFDSRKPDNNIVFSWEYEQSQAMMQIVQANYFKKYPNLKIIVHHAGALVPFFTGRVDYILPQEQSQDFRKFYVDTAILGNDESIAMAINYFGVDKVIFAADVPFGVPDAKGTEVTINSIERQKISRKDKEKIFHTNLERLLEYKQKQN